DVRVRILTGDGLAVPDAVVETWQSELCPDAGRLNHKLSDESGLCILTDVRPTDYLVARKRGVGISTPARLEALDGGGDREIKCLLLPRASITVSLPLTWASRPGVSIAM